MMSSTFRTCTRSSGAKWWIIQSLTIRSATMTATESGNHRQPLTTAGSMSHDDDPRPELPDQQLREVLG